MKKITENDLRIFKFLIDERWCDIECLIYLLQTKSSAYYSVQKLINAGLIKKEKNFEIKNKGNYLYSMTKRGLEMFMDGDEIKKYKYFNASRMPKTMYNHSINIKYCHAVAENYHFENWINYDNSKFKRKNNYPDAKTKYKNNIFAIELELTIKSRNRYSHIFSSYIELMLDKKIDYVIYINSDLNYIKRIEKIFYNLRIFEVNNDKIEIDKNIRKRFIFSDFNIFSIIEKDNAQ